MEFLTREQCARLKVAGFPQGGCAFWWNAYHDGTEPLYVPGLQSGTSTVPITACPTLQELIADLGDLFLLVRRHLGVGVFYKAWGWANPGTQVYDVGATPLQAVFLLWLEVKGKATGTHFAVGPMGGERVG